MLNSSLEFKLMVYSMGSRAILNKGLENIHDVEDLLKHSRSTRRGVVDLNGHVSWAIEEGDYELLIRLEKAITKLNDAWDVINKRIQFLNSFGEN